MTGGAVNEFDAKRIQIGTDPKQIYLIDKVGNRFTFSYDIYCHMRPSSTKFNFFFQLKTGKLLIAYADEVSFSNEVNNYKCGVMRFWVRNDEPRPAVEWFANMAAMMKAFQPQFAEQLASYSLDEIINSSDSESV